MAGKAKDLTGYTTPEGVVVLKRIENKGNKPQWLCKCFCGNEFVTRSDALKSGHTKSCGCLQKKKASEILTKRNKDLALDLTNQRFGKLVALENTHKQTPGGTALLWKCVCDCGNYCEISSSRLVSGITQSCGCISSHGEEKIQKILQENKIQFERQKTFESCRVGNNHKARFDFYLPDYNILIEYDGNVHYYANGYGWNNKENLTKVKNNDKIKNEWCKNNNISLIRIPYFIYDTITIEDLLLNSKYFIVKEKQNG